MAMGACAERVHPSEFVYVISLDPYKKHGCS